MNEAILPAFTRLLEQSLKLHHETVKRTLMQNLQKFEKGAGAPAEGELRDSVAAAFQQSVIPAIERATQKMFEQIHVRLLFAPIERLVTTTTPSSFAHCVQTALERGLAQSLGGAGSGASAEQFRLLLSTQSLLTDNLRNATSTLISLANTLQRTAAPSSTPSPSRTLSASYSSSTSLRFASISIYICVCVCCSEFLATAAAIRTEVGMPVGLPPPGTALQPPGSPLAGALPPHALFVFELEKLVREGKLEEAFAYVRYTCPPPPVYCSVFPTDG